MIIRYIIVTLSEAQAEALLNLVQRTTSHEDEEPMTRVSLAQAKDAAAVIKKALR